MKRLMAICATVVLCLSISSCTVTRPERKAPGPSPSAASSPEAISGTGGITISDPGGKTIWAVIREGQRYVVRDGQGGTAAFIKIEADRAKMSDAGGKPLCKIKKKDIGCKVYDGSDQELYRIRNKEGELKIRDTKDNEIAHIRTIGNELSIKSTPPCKVKESGGDVEIVDDKGAVLFRLSGQIKKEEACFMAITAIDPLQRIALAVFYRDVR